MTRVALVTVLAAISLPIGLAFIAEPLGLHGDALEVVAMVGWFVFLPGCLLLVPVLLVVAVVEYAVGREYRGRPIVASWTVRLDGECYVVSLPATRVALPDHAWVDGARMPLRWAQVDDWSSDAVLGGGRFNGKISATNSKVEAAAVVLLEVAAGGNTGGPSRRFALEVERATVEAVPIADGERHG